MKKNCKSLKQWILEEGYSIAGLARKIGITRQHLSKVVNGLTKPSNSLKNTLLHLSNNQTKFPPLKKRDPTKKIESL